MSQLVGVRVVRNIYHQLSGDVNAEILRIIATGGVLEIQFRKPWPYRVGQWVLLNCKDADSQEWHSYSITSTPFDAYLSVHVPKTGKFGRTLEERCETWDFEALDPDGMVELPLEKESTPILRLNGPYGNPVEDLFAKDHVILVGTDIDIFPWMGILKHLWHLRAAAANTDATRSGWMTFSAGSWYRRLFRNKPTRFPYIELVWMISSSALVPVLQPLLSALEEQNIALQKPDKVTLGIQIYYTSSIDPDSVNNIVLNAIGSERDPLSELRTRTNFGQPDFNRILRGLESSVVDGLRVYGKAEGQRVNVGVYYYGSGDMGKEIQSACKKASSQRAGFEYWETQTQTPSKTRRRRGYLYFWWSRWQWARQDHLSRKIVLSDSQFTTPSLDAASERQQKQREMEQLYEAVLTYDSRQSQSHNNGSSG